MTHAISALAIAVLVATMAVHATAQTKAPAAHDHSNTTHATPAARDTPATKAFKAANHKMHAEMNIPFTGNADIDFVKGMIPHHKGAVEMAKIVLEHGRDPALKKLAADIIKARDDEIAFMSAWLAKNAPK